MKANQTMKITKTNKGITAHGINDICRGSITAHFNSRMTLVAATIFRGTKTRDVRKGGAVWGIIQRRSNIIRYKASR